MENKFYKVTNIEELETVQNFLISEGYKTPTGQLITFEDLKRCFPRNKIYVINAFYNSITKRKEYQVGTTQIYKTYGYDKIKFETI